MKIENTIENKAKFLAQHLGQMLKYPSIGNKTAINKLSGVTFDYVTVDYKRKIKGCSGEELSFKSNGFHNCDALHAKLLLRSICDITDEEIKEAAELVGLANVESINMESDRILINDDSYQLEISFKGNVQLRKNNVLYEDRSILKIYQYLQTKGFLLPYFRLSIEKLIEYGWVELLKQKIKNS